jgi:hypothetical protein
MSVQVKEHSNDGREWPIHRNSRGWPRWYQPWLEAWLIITGEWSLHRAWQSGRDHGSLSEWQRIVRGGDAEALRNMWDLRQCSPLPDENRPVTS